MVDGDWGPAFIQGYGAASNRRYLTAGPLSTLTK